MSVYRDAFFPSCMTCHERDDRTPGHWQCCACGAEWDVEDPKEKRIEELSKSLEALVENCMGAYRISLTDDDIDRERSRFPDNDEYVRGVKP